MNYLFFYLNHALHKMLIGSCHSATVLFLVCLLLKQKGYDFVLSDVADSRNITSGKENGAEQGPDKDNTSFLPIATGKGNKSTTFISRYL